MRAGATSFSIALAAALLAAPADADDICVDPGKAGCEDTVQAGVDAASPGDVVEIAKGTYAESVVIATEGITLEGDGIDDTIIRTPATEGSTGILVTDGADNVTIADLTVRTELGPGILIGEGSDGVRVEKVEVTDVGAGACILSDGDDTAIEKSRIGACNGPCVLIDGDDSLVSKTEVAGCASNAVLVAGDGATIEKSELMRAGAGACLLVDGDNSTVTDTEISVCNGQGILCAGDGVLIDDNEIWATASDGILLSCPEGGCSAGQVFRNQIRDAGGLGISVFGDPGAPNGVAIEKNAIQYAAREGVGVTGDGVTLVKNRVGSSGAGSGDCFSLLGDDLVAEKNRAKGCAGNGFGMAGDTGSYTRNQARNSAASGFDLQGEEEDDGFSVGNLLDGNKAKGNGNHGVHLSGIYDEGDVLDFGAANTALVGNKAKKNLRADLCDAGADTADDGSNKFGTVDEDRDAVGDCLDY